MQSRVGPIGLLALVLVAVWVLPARAGQEAPKAPRTPNLFVFSLGAVHWSELHDLDPSGSPFANDLGRFHTWGFGLDFAYQRRVARWGSVDVLLGGDLGVMTHENSKEPEFLLLPFNEELDGSLSANCFYVTPGVRFVIGSTQRWRFLVGGGLGIYTISFDEQIDEFYGYSGSEELWDDSSLGGFFSAAADFRLWLERPRWRLRFESRTHFVDFGDTSPFAPGAGDLGGPISTMLFGFVWDR